MFITGTRGVVLFARGSDSRRFSPRNRSLAAFSEIVVLQHCSSICLTAEKEIVDARTAEFRFDIGLLAEALTVPRRGLANNPKRADLRSLLRREHRRRSGSDCCGKTSGNRSRGCLPRRSAGSRGCCSRGSASADSFNRRGNDHPVITLNGAVLDQLRCEKQLEIIPAATQLFEEPGTLEKVAALALDVVPESLSGVRWNPRREVWSGVIAQAEIKREKAPMLPHKHRGFCAGWPLKLERYVAVKQRTPGTEGCSYRRRSSFNVAILWPMNTGSMKVPIVLALFALSVNPHAPIHHCLYSKRWNSQLKGFWKTLAAGTKT